MYMFLAMSPDSVRGHVDHADSSATLARFCKRRRLKPQACVLALLAALSVALLCCRGLPEGQYAWPACRSAQVGLASIPSCNRPRVSGLRQAAFGSAHLPLCKRQRLSLVRRATGDGGADGVSVEQEDWRDFRARLVLQEKSGNSDGTADSETGWAYQTDLLEQGSLIVSVPGDFWSLRRQYFCKVVMLVVSHNKQGTMALVLNRPTNFTTRDVCLDGFDLPQDLFLKMIGLSDGSEPWKVWFGGDCDGLEALAADANPCHFCLHTMENLADESQRIIRGIFLTDLTRARRIVQRGDARKEDFMVIVGYTGWGPGQLEDELKRGDVWILGAADKGLLLSAPGDQQTSLTERLETACAGQFEGSTVPASANSLGDGIHHWNRLYEALRPNEYKALDAEEEAHNDEMIRRWIESYLGQAPNTKRGAECDTASEGAPLRAGTILRGSATKWLLGRPNASWPSRQKADPWLLPGTYFHKAVFVLLRDSTRDAPAMLVLLNGPRIGELNIPKIGDLLGSIPVFFGGSDRLDRTTFLPVPGGGGIVGRFELPAGVLQELLEMDAVAVAPGVDLDSILATTRDLRWREAGGTLQTLGEVSLSTQGDRQRRKWYRSVLGLHLQPDE